MQKNYLRMQTILSENVEDYNGLLNEAFQNAPNKQEILQNAKEKGYASFPRAIEEYMSTIEDDTQLEKIKDNLGIESSNESVQYLLWRNANKNDGFC